MRHQLAIFIGEGLSVLANGVKQYVLKYGNDAVVPYFHSMMWGIGNDGSISIKKYDRVSPSNSDFESNLDSEYLTGVAEVKTIKQEDLYIQDFLNSFRNETITIECPGDSGKLLVSLYVPMYDSASSKLAEQIIDVAHEVNSKFEIDVIALTSDVVRKIHDITNFVENVSQYKKDFISNLKVFSEYARSLENRKVNQLVVLDNKNRSGIALDFNKESLICTLGEYSLLTIENYGSVYNQNIVLNSQGEVTTFGLSSLYFDRYYFINYVLRKAYINLIDKEKVCEDGGEGCSWDVNWAADQAKNLIGKHVGMVGKFWNEKINPLIVKEVSQSQIVSQITPELNKVYDDLEKDLISFLSDHSLSLPQKKALLAMLTANDDESLQGNLLMSDTMSIDDLDSEPTNFFINESHTLAEDSEYRLPDLPTKEIKKLRNDIRQSTAYLRKKTEELEKLGKQIDNVEQSKKIVDGKITVGDCSYKLITNVISEQLLEETYVPHEVKVPSVDLSSWFTPVKNQADLGACTVFSLVSIFEYIMKKKTGEDYDLSEMFVYYNARKKLGKQNEDCGTSLYHVVKAMSDEGVCLENNCNYNVNSYSEVPYDSAYEDGKSRLVEVAKNMPIEIDAIRCALSEGYPVAVAFKIFGSFDAPNGFAITPTEEELGTEGGYHAMVVVGYNDEHKLLKVRNSWGKNWGDKGYCYIPYSWITTLKLAADACIITKTNQDDDVNRRMDYKSVDFDLTDANIRSYILYNLVFEETKKLESLKLSYAEKRKEYEGIVQKLGNHGNRKAIIAESQKVLEAELEDCKRYKAKRAEELQAEVIAYEQNTNRVLIKTGLFMLSTIALICTLWYYYSDIQLAVFDTGNVMLKTTLVLAVVLAVIGVLVFYFYRNYRKIQLKGMQEEMKRTLENMAHEIQKKKRVIDELGLKCNIYGTSLDRLISIQSKLVEKYRASVSFVGNLRAWRNDESEKQNAMKSETNRSFVPVLDNSKLDSFVAEHVSDITKDLVLYKYLVSDFKLSDEALLEFKNRVKGSVIEKIKSYCSDFSMVDYLLGDSSYDYADKKDLKKVLPVMQSCSEPFCETKDTMTYAQTKTIDVFANIGINGPRWKTEFCSQFQEMPTTVSRLANHSVVLLQQRFVSIDDIVI